MKTVVFAAVTVTSAQDIFLEARSPRSCPGGSLSKCMELCPSSPSAAFSACIQQCASSCSDSTTTAAPAPAPTPTPAPTPSPAPTPPGQCTDYDTGSGNCGNDCGNCKNAGSRSGVMCKGSSTGYYCASDSPGEGEDMAFACMDWTFGSSAMKAQQEVFKKRTGEDVFFGVGTFGTADDAQQGLGSCFRLQVDGVSTDLLLQSINTGSDVAGTQFDLQIGDGGAGAFNTCAGGSSPGHDTMYPGPYSMDTWGRQYGGVDTKAQCQNLPKYPEVSALMEQAGDDLISLCEYGFDQGVRGQTGQNPSILSIGRVECPEELVYMTQIHRNDDPSGFSCGSDCVQAPHECELNTGGTSAAWCLTRMMDCRKPSGGFIDNIKKELMVEGHNLVQPCTSDGYTRIDVQCGCSDCYC